jgi:uncharacterized membrane protein
MSKAQTRQGAGRSGTARAGANGKGRRTTGGAASASANGARTGARNGGAQRGGSGGASKGTQRGAAGGTRAVAATGGQKRPATGATAARAKSATTAPVQGRRRLLGMSGIEASTLGLSIIGLGIAIYATILHFDTSLKPFCSATGFINCESVMTSSQSVVFGIFPVSVLGMAFFLFMIAINGPWAWRAKFPAVMGGRVLNSRPDLIKWTRLGALVVGMGFAIYLVYVELVQLSEICLWCTGVHIVTFLLFVIVVFHASFSTGRTEPSLRT